MHYFNFNIPGLYAKLLSGGEGGQSLRYIKKSGRNADNTKRKKNDRNGGRYLLPPSKYAYIPNNFLLLLLLKISKSVFYKII